MRTISLLNVDQREKGEEEVAEYLSALQGLGYNR